MYPCTSLYWCLYSLVLAFAFHICTKYTFYIIQLNLNSSNTDGSFTMVNSNSFLSPYEILLIAQENGYLMVIFLFYPEIVCCVYSLELPHRGDSNEYTQHTIIV